MTTLHYTIKVNHSRKSATIRLYNAGRCISKYRAVNLSAQEIDCLPFFSQRDISEYLRTNEVQLLK